MQINNVSISSQNFIGVPNDVIQGINLFLNDLKSKHHTKKEFHLVHALVFSKSMSEAEVFEVNEALSNVYRSTGFDVLGGDTSSGAELSIFISTIVC
jgi:hydrogenase maturation factor